LISLNTAAIVLGMSSFLLGTFFLSLYRQKRQRHLQVWSAGWFVLSAYSLLAPFLPAQPRAPWLYFLDDWLLAATALIFYGAARLYVHRSAAARAIAAAAAAGAAWCAAFAYGRFPVSPMAGTAVVFFLVAETFWTSSRKQESRAGASLAAPFAIWGALTLAKAFPSSAVSLTSQILSTAVFLPVLFAGVFIVIAVYEDERKHVERNILALSNLNLATSGFTGTEIEKMLGQALERVMNVARLPGGALCLHYGEGGPNAIAVAGLRDTFSASMRENNLDKYAVDLVARLGGLIRLLDLADNSEYEALEKEEPFRQLRKLLLDQGLRTVIGISLQVKERSFGLLLLGTSENRIFTAADLKLLLGLCHQIGMAVENSYLVQQTSRRTEELHILNEIGRALSSTLDLDSLLERIYSEVGRLMDVANFYIAFQESKTDEIRFEIEMLAGKRAPKRSRPAGNHLVEYVIRTRQPLLIRERYLEETQRLGFVALQKSNSVCAVPLILYDRAVGVLVVHTLKERAFDEGHLELLRVLASAAAIAIENARLFTEEQKKSRHLSLINNVSSHAITTLNPEEMLAKIAIEIENSLAYEHIGIAILDYSTKELVVQAEAGKRKDALGRRIGLAEGMIGQVARSGQVAMVREANASTPNLVLEGSVSSIGLPVVYAEQLLGVLYVECSQPCDLPEQEILLLRTLADLFAGALHNALTFQKAQEQAITDGLTGVKTHRFLVEALDPRESSFRACADGP
jgi:GAF domain-containing protein